MSITFVLYEVLEINSLPDSQMRKVTDILKSCLGAREIVLQLRHVPCTHQPGFHPQHHIWSSEYCQESGPWAEAEIAPEHCWEWLTNNHPLLKKKVAQKEQSAIRKPSLPRVTWHPWNPSLYHFPLESVPGSTSWGNSYKFKFLPRSWIKNRNSDSGWAPISEGRWCPTRAWSCPYSEPLLTMRLHQTQPEASVLCLGHPVPSGKYMCCEPRCTMQTTVPNQEINQGSEIRKSSHCPARLSNWSLFFNFYSQTYKSDSNKKGVISQSLP